MQTYRINISIYLVDVHDLHVFEPRAVEHLEDLGLASVRLSGVRGRYHQVDLGSIEGVVELYRGRRRPRPGVDVLVDRHVRDQVAL